jgi:hypothetical protein
MTLIGHEAVGQQLRAHLAYFSAIRIPPALLGDVMYFNANILFPDTQQVLHSPDFL